LDSSESWDLPGESGGIDMGTVMAHEFGHALGLGHTSDSSALMYAYYVGDHRYLATDDINGIQALYGGSGTPLPCASLSTGAAAASGLPLGFLALLGGPATWLGLLRRRARNQDGM
jgi:hypothetical protein